MKNFLSTYIAVVLAGLTLMFIQDLYVKSQLNQLTKAASKASEQSYEEREQAKRDNEAAEKQLKSEIALMLCKEALHSHHGKQAIDLEIVRSTPTFAAFTYSVSGIGYHSKCIVDDRKERVTDFDATKLG
jgi:hypothetical protein